MHNNQCMIAKILTKDFMIMRLKNSKQFNNHEYLYCSKGLRLRPVYNGLHESDIFESRLEGP